jgi:4-hydroxy-3-methylbut-2-enyl diphosphate reductase
MLIGHAGHPEVIGTMGQLPLGKVVLVEDVAQAETLSIADPENSPSSPRPRCRSTTRPASCRAARRFPRSRAAKKEDICYATTNRQAAVKAIAERCDAMVVIGAPNSSNSMRLVEVAANYGCAKSRLCSAPPTSTGTGSGSSHRLGLTAGASAPELLVDELIEACRSATTSPSRKCARRREESVVFKLPRALVA